MIKQLISGVAVLIISSNVFAQNFTAANHSVDTFVNDKIKHLGIPGLAIAVIKNGVIIKQSVYGMANLEWKNKVTTHTNFQIASCTKLLTSTLFLKAIYQKKISLGDKLSKYIDALPSTWKDLEIKHLVNHSSGIRNFNGDLYLSTEAVVNALKDSTLEYAPGTDQHYAQFDFMFAGYILEKIYGKPFTQLLHDEVTAPLKMNDGGFDMEKKTGTFMRTDLISQKATTYYDLNGKMQAYKFLYPEYTYTAGGYFASIDDMSKWAIALDKETLFPKTFAEAYMYGRDSIGNKLSDFTDIGWAIEKEGSIMYGGHSGGPGLGDIWRFPEEGFTFIALSNDGELLPDISRAIASYYIKDLPAKLEIKKFER